MTRTLSFLILAAFLSVASAAERLTLPLADGWRSVCYPEGQADSLVAPSLALPHNWDDYYGSRQYTHGNLHGSARYERTFTLPAAVQYRRVFLQLEGAGSYLSVWLNGREVCVHRPAGRLVTTLDLTPYLDMGEPLSRVLALSSRAVTPEQHLVVLCEHPSMITDLPWVCGGCSSEWGFSEGSAPLGLFRPVSLVITDPVRIEPFGVHVWHSAALDSVYVTTEVHNYSDQPAKVKVRNEVPGYKAVSSSVRLAPGETREVCQRLAVRNLHLWSPTDPFLYRVQTRLSGASTDAEQTVTGFNSMRWPRRTADGRLDDSDHRFYVNGQPTFIHGTCEYEHRLGQSHAFGDEEIAWRTQLVHQMGFNAFRDAHQPHNLRYQAAWDSLGILWWPQFSAHIWYDTPQFRQNFQTLLRQWVRERRNSPSVMLWGLQNESTLPEDFSRECSDIIRQLDPLCAQPGKSGGRLITTCNGGSGTDWNVIQNWSGTYGGKLDDYGLELSKDDQLLNGEYGGWRVQGFHDGQDTAQVFDDKAPWSEEHFCRLMHRKLSLAWQHRADLCGQFQWILFSHDNPGRQQPDEGYRLIDKIGPYNYKGLLTAWGEPTDAYYLYCAWGKALRAWWAGGDTAELTALCNRPATEIIAGQRPSALLPTLRTLPGRHYLYRYNCGGDAVIDSHGNRWMSDDLTHSHSWAQSPRFATDSLIPVLASQGVERRPLAVRLPEADQQVLRSYRYGRHELRFAFRVPANMAYLVETYEGQTGEPISYQSRTLWADERGMLTLQYPDVKVGQMRVAAIAISLSDADAATMGDAIAQITRPADFSSSSLMGPGQAEVTWAQLDTMVCAKTPKEQLPADRGGRPVAKFTFDGTEASVQMGLAQEYALRIRYKNTSGAAIHAKWQLLAQQDGRLVCQGNLTLPVTPPKFKMVSTTTGTFVNAGHYRLVITQADGAEFESVEVQ